MTEEEKTYIPDTERRKVYWFARSYVLIYASAIGWACSIGSMADGFVMDRLIERPKHNGHFDFTTGQAKRAPACRPLKTYPVKVEAGRVLIYLHSSEQESQR
jgi:nitrite reductase/ring-hydroxylating ferredoxin subunit